MKDALTARFLREEKFRWAFTTLAILKKLARSVFLKISLETGRDAITVTILKKLARGVFLKMSLEFGRDAITLAILKNHLLVDIARRSIFLKIFLEGGINATTVSVS